MAADPGETWPEEPDRWEEADQEWAGWQEEHGGQDAGRRDAPAPNAVEAYARGMTEAGPYLGLGLQIAGAMALFTGGGYLADRALGTSPWGIIVGAALAFVGIMALVVRIARKE